MKRHSITAIVYKAQALTLRLVTNDYMPATEEKLFERAGKIGRAAVNEIIKLEAEKDN